MARSGTLVEATPLRMLTEGFPVPTAARRLRSAP
jgi:hypothetical protein